MSAIDPFMLLMLLVVALIVGTTLFAWLVRITRRPHGAEQIAALLLGLLVLESALYSDQSLVPAGLFHPEAGALSFRLFDILIPLALAARLVAGRKVQSIPAQAMLWIAFLVWIACAAVEGYLDGNSIGLIAFHAKEIVYLGIFPLIAAVPPRRWLESRALRRVVVASSVGAAVLLVTSQANLALNVPIPLLPLSDFGALGADAASIFATLGIGALIMGLCRERNRLGAFATALPLLATPLASGQRAAMIALAVSAGLLLVLLSIGWRRLRVLPAEVMLCLLAAGAIVVTLVLVDLVAGGSEVRLPLQQEIDQAFTSRGKQLSGQDRVNQWEQVGVLIDQRPLLGWGLGKEYDYYSPGFFEFMRTDITHNIGLDLLLRTGFVGLLLFAAALALTFKDSVLAWVTDGDAVVAAVGLACAVALAGMVTKGMFESVLEKYRLAILIGGLVGVSTSVAIARLAPAAQPLAVRGRSHGGALAR